MPPEILNILAGLPPALSGEAFDTIVESDVVREKPTGSRNLRGQKPTEKPTGSGETYGVYHRIIADDSHPLKRYYPL